uniref:C2H2-type domain-containing protein n=1 Tax=Panagrellus redivivus TaxID=6233 RepID=A0A7E4VJT3_PANRE
MNPNLALARVPYGHRQDLLRYLSPAERYYLQLAVGNRIGDLVRQPQVLTYNSANHTFVFIADIVNAGQVNVFRIVGHHHSVRHALGNINPTALYLIKCKLELKCFNSRYLDSMTMGHFIFEPTTVSLYACFIDSRFIDGLARLIKSEQLTWFSISSFCFDFRLMPLLLASFNFSDLSITHTGNIWVNPFQFFPNTNQALMYFALKTNLVKLFECMTPQDFIDFMDARPAGFYISLTNISPYNLAAVMTAFRSVLSPKFRYMRYLMEYHRSVMIRVGDELVYYRYDPRGKYMPPVFLFKLRQTRGQFVKRKRGRRITYYCLWCTKSFAGRISSYHMRYHLTLAGHPCCPDLF